MAIGEARQTKVEVPKLPGQRNEQPRICSHFECNVALGPMWSLNRPKEKLTSADPAPGNTL